MITRRSDVAAAAALVLLLAACGDGPRTPATTPPPGDAAPPAAPARWTAIELPGPARFRAYGWGAGDTLWGIARGRVAMASLSGDTLVQPVTAWGVGTVPGSELVWWTAADGLHVQDGAETTMAVAAADAPSPEHTGPDVLWSPDGRRALLTWTAEAGPAHSVLDERGHRQLRARLPGHMLGANGVWLDSVRVLLPATSFRSATGAAEYRESGYRTDLAVLDVARDTAMLVVTSEDGEFLRFEGWLHPDTVLVGVRHPGTLGPHMALDIRDWRMSVRVDDDGRAAASRGVVALLRPISGPGEGGETKWELEMIGRDGTRQIMGQFQGEVRLLWHPTEMKLAVAQDSEAPAGYRTVIVQ